MANPRPPSIGDVGVNQFTLMREEYPLPKSRQEVLSAVSRILNLGGVQKLAIKLGEPIQVYRIVPTEGMPLTTLEELEATDLYGQIRNSRMEAFEFKVKDQSSYESLFVAFQSITASKLVARSFVVNDYKMLRAWLGLSALEDVTMLYGVPCVLHADVPDDILLLAATTPDNLDGVELTLRLEMA